MYSSEDFERLFIRYKVVEVDVAGHPSPAEADKPKDAVPQQMKETSTKMLCMFCV